MGSYPTAQQNQRFFDSMRTTKRTTSPKRRICCFEPKVCAELIGAELRARKKRRQTAAFRKLMEEAVILHLGPKFPKLCPSLPEMLISVRTS